MGVCHRACQCAKNNRWLADSRITHQTHCQLDREPNAVRPGPGTRRQGRNILLSRHQPISGSAAMKIINVSAIPMSAPVPLDKRHRTDLGTKVKSDATLIRVETDTGLVGIGAALGTPPIVAAIIAYELAGECIGEDPIFSERIYEKMYNGSRSKPALERGVTQADESRRRGVIMEAISGIDIAIWDVKAQALGIPLYQALGAVRRSVRGYASGGWAPGDEAEAELGSYAAKGFTAVKMRVVGRDGFSIANCVRRVRAARRGIGPDVELMIDAHGSLEVATAIKLARELEEYNIAWFEEPVTPDDHAGQAEVRRSTTIPIASGEREFTRFDFVDLLERRAIDIAQPDVARAGGLTEIRRIAALTSAHGVRLAPHAWGSGVLFAASIHVAMSAPNCHILEVTQGYMPMMWGLFNEPFDIRPDGTVHAPNRPGLGFTLRADALERFRYVDGPEFKF
ncbi:MAG: mandelate racemase/muconate lactonizing enzyme family protein [Acetobacteraceae bacterium]|nr:mandelate racemase/muconate lactonizing enzyme family protein [Acetobacteraceae bacterium]